MSTASLLSRFIVPRFHDVWSEGGAEEVAVGAGLAEPLEAICRWHKCEREF
jgi:hypothetical protein